MSDTTRTMRHIQTSFGGDHRIYLVSNSASPSGNDDFGKVCGRAIKYEK